MENILNLQSCKNKIVRYLYTFYPDSPKANILHSTMIKIETLFLTCYSYQTPDLIQTSPLTSGPRSNEESEVAVAACISFVSFNLDHFLSPLFFTTFDAFEKYWPII